MSSAPSQGGPRRCPWFKESLACRRSRPRTPSCCDGRGQLGTLLLGRVLGRQRAQAFGRSACQRSRRCVGHESEPASLNRTRPAGKHSMGRRAWRRPAPLLVRSVPPEQGQYEGRSTSLPRRRTPWMPPSPTRQARSVRWAYTKACQSGTSLRAGRHRTVTVDRDAHYLLNPS